MRYSMSRVRYARFSQSAYNNFIAALNRYYEWLTKGKEKLPHFTKRKDGKLLLLAGLYDCVTLDGAIHLLHCCAINFHDRLRRETPVDILYCHNRREQGVFLAT